MLALPINEHGTTIGGALAPFIAMPVALVICLPILFAVAIAGVAAGALLSELGVPHSVSGFPGLAGFIGGLALSFLVLVRLYRRLPAWIKGWIASDDEPDEPPAPPLGRDSDADADSIAARLAAADARLTSDPGSPAPRDT